MSIKFSKCHSNSIITVSQFLRRMPVFFLQHYTLISPPPSFLLHQLQNTLSEHWMSAGCCVCNVLSGALVGISLSKEMCLLVNVNFASYFSPPCLSLEWQQLTLKSCWQVRTNIILLHIVEAKSMRGAAGSAPQPLTSRDCSYRQYIETGHSCIYKHLTLSAPNIQTASAMSMQCQF